MITDRGWMVVRSFGAYLLCLAIYFVYNRSIPQPNAPQLGIIPYLVISLWCVWIFAHNRFLLRGLLFRKKILYYIVCLLAGVALTAFIQKQILFSLKGIDNPLPTTMVTVAFYTFVGTVIFLAFLYIKERRDFYQTVSLKKEVELQQLKNQLNPHFLFNSLNNIYSYNMENSTHGNDLILKLSDLMRFIVESTRKDKVKLEEEISFIENYIAFEKERLGYRCDIMYEKKITDGSQSIPPLMLFPFIENAFKHGANTIERSYVTIYITSSDSTLLMDIKNSISGKSAPSTGTGLMNIERRLELVFPGRYQLQAGVQSNEYVVHLELQLA